MYLLDTDICSYLMKRKYPALIERVRGFSPLELKVSVITLYELEYGAIRSARREHIFLVLRQLLKNVEVLAFDSSAARTAASIRADLTSRGTPIGAHDFQIAGHAMARGAILVTNNVREFSRVPGLQVENWVEP
jgi:tRNA(fMet)-specific endonuclease VapC